MLLAGSKRERGSKLEKRKKKNAFAIMKCKKSHQLCSPTQIRTYKNISIFSLLTRPVVHKSSCKTRLPAFTRVRTVSLINLANKRVMRSLYRWPTTTFFSQLFIKRTSFSFTLMAWTSFQLALALKFQMSHNSLFFCRKQVSRAATFKILKLVDRKVDKRYQTHCGLRA